MTFRAVVGFDQIGEQLEAAVGGGVVDEDNFVGTLHRFQARRSTDRRGGRIAGSSLWIRYYDGQHACDAFSVAGYDCARNHQHNLPAAGGDGRGGNAKPCSPGQGRGLLPPFRY